MQKEQPPIQKHPEVSVDLQNLNQFSGDVITDRRETQPINLGITRAADTNPVHFDHPESVQRQIDVWHNDGGARELTPDEQALIEQGNIIREKATEKNNQDLDHKEPKQESKKTDDEIPDEPLAEPVQNTEEPKVKKYRNQQEVDEEERRKKKELLQREIIENSGGTAMIAYALLEQSSQHNPQLLKKLNRKVNSAASQKDIEQAIAGTFAINEAKKLKKDAQKAERTAEIVEKGETKLQKRADKIAAAMEDTTALYTKRTELTQHAQELLAHGGINVTGRIGAWIDRKRIHNIDRRIRVSSEKGQLVATIEQEKEKLEKTARQMEEVAENKRNLAELLRPGQENISEYVRQHLDAMSEAQLCKVLGISQKDLAYLQSAEEKHRLGLYDDESLEKTRQRRLGSVNQAGVAVGLANEIYSNELNDQYSVHEINNAMPTYVRNVRQSTRTPAEKRLDAIAEVAQYGAMALLGLISMAVIGKRENKE